MKFINSRLHGILDYVVVAFLLLSPSIFNLPELTALFTYVLGGIHLGLTLFTNFEAGVIKIIPLKIHGMIELIVSIALIGVAFYFGSREGSLARNFYIAFGAAVFFTWLGTDYTTAETSSKE